MNMPSSSQKTFGQPATNVADEAAASADNAVRNTQRRADEAFDSLSSKVEDLRNQGRHVIHTGGRYDSHLLVPVVPSS